MPERSWLEVIGDIAHLALYALMVAVIVLGIANAFMRGYDLFGVWTLPKLPGDPALVRTVNHWHDLAANALILLAGLHATAALFHYIILHDDVLPRMIPALRSTDFPSKKSDLVRTTDGCITENRRRRSPEKSKPKE